MLKFVCLALCLAVASATSPVITPFGIVEPVERCGGAGLPLQLRVTDCTVPPCIVHPEQTYIVEGDFVPSKDADQLTLKVSMILPGVELVMLEAAVENSAVVGGQMYTLNYPMVPSDLLVGATLDLQLEISITATAEVEICVRAPVSFVANK